MQCSRLKHSVLPLPVSLSVCSFIPAPTGRRVASKFLAVKVPRLPRTSRRVRKASADVSLCIFLSLALSLSTYLCDTSYARALPRRYTCSFDLCSGRTKTEDPISIERTPKFDFEKLFAIDPKVLQPSTLNTQFTTYTCLPNPVFSRVQDSEYFTFMCF